jgi:two-component system invasion response regulator UvrY
MSPITVLIADRDETRRAACVRILQPEKGIRLFGRAQSGLEDLLSIAKLKPSILLLDLNLLQGKEIAQLFSLRQISPRTKVILLTHRTPETRILKALSCGARGCIEEKVLGTFLAKAVRCVDAGEAWVPRKMVAMIIERLARITARD